MSNTKTQPKNYGMFVKGAQLGRRGSDALDREMLRSSCAAFQADLARVQAELERTRAQCNELQEIAKRLETQLGEQRASNRDLLAACKACEHVFHGWLHDADPHNDLARGESADRDAAADMLSMMQAAIANAERTQP